MARSYHTTKKHLVDAQRFNESDANRRAANIERLRKQLDIKNRVKSQIKRERHNHPVPATTPVQTIPIIVSCDSIYVHFPASLDDLKAILDVLPIGVADDLMQIELSLGNKPSLKRSEDLEEYSRQPIPDPYVGRLGYETLPGIFLPLVLGQYFPAKKKIKIYGFVYDTTIPDRSMWEFYLRLQMLMTFVHEIAHHWDFTARLSRGRWRGDNKDKIEVYAETVEQKWISTYVIPYLQNTYRKEWDQLQAWMATQIGVEIPLALLTGAVQVSVKNGRLYVNSAAFDTASAFDDFVTSFYRGEDITKTRIQFARDLHYAENYDLANNILDLVLADNSCVIEALTLKGDILIHEGKHEKALQIAQESLGIDDDNADAMEVAADAYLGLGMWMELATIAEKLLKKNTNNWEFARAMAHRARARMELGEVQAALDDIKAIESLPSKAPSFKRRADTLKERLKEIIDPASCG